jgi:beta-glucanase (GH16 family)
MGNIAFGNKYFILSKFSSIPKTAKIEKERANLIKELEEHTSFNDSEELAAFQELEKYLNSNEHKKLMESISSKKNAEKERQEHFIKQNKSKSFKQYFKFKESQKLKEYLQFKDSKELSDYHELKEFVTHSSFNSTLTNLEKKLADAAEKEKRLAKLEKSSAIKNHFKNKDKEDYKPSAEVNQFLKLMEEINAADFKAEKADAEKELNNLQAKAKEYKSKKKSSSIKKFFKFQKSQKLKTFESFEASKELADYFKLKEYLASDEHKELLESLEQQEKVENAKIKQAEDFKKSDSYKKWLSLKDSNKFDELKSWEVTFEDDFTSKNLDTEKWMTRFLWGDKLLNDAYALESDKAFPTDGKNLEFSNSILKIVTKQEKTNGKVWKPPFGFIPQDFNYTTGLISSAKSFKQKYGKFEAKIKVNYAKPVNYNFWMASEKMLPHVDILKLEKKKTQVDMAHHTGDIASSKKPETAKADFSGLDVSQDFFIYTFEWSKDKMVWKINDIVVNEQTKSIPAEEMYLVFSSSMTGKADGSGLPASIEVDWVRCYKKA